MSYDRFGPYIVHECLGTGGMATVHRATLELEDGGACEVALKRLLPQLADDRKLVEDFIREARLASQLQHPNIVRILEAGRIQKTYFIAMELVKGHSLVTLLRHTHLGHRSTPIGVVLGLGIELCDALDYAHEGTNDEGEAMKVVHRDLSPANLLVSEDGHLKVIDFGVAKALAGQLQTNSGLAKGKLGYMSLDAMSGKHVDERTDIFSAGVVMWELLTGRRLFRGKNEIEVITQIQRGEVEPPSRYSPECPIELDAIVIKATAREPAARFQSAAALRRELVKLRRFHVQDSQPAAVNRWVETLIPQVHESTEIGLQTDDIEELGLAEGSRREDPRPPAPIVAPEPAPTKPRFVESDTVITGERLGTEED